MKKISLSVALIFLFLFNLSASPPKKMDLDYFENKGQWNEKVLFKADIYGGWAFLEKSTITYLFFESDKILHNHQHDILDNNQPYLPKQATQPQSKLIKGHVYKVNYINANSTTQCNGENQTSFYNNYFKGSNPSKWADHVSGFKTIHYNNLYNQIDLKIYSASKYMKSDYIVKKGGNPLDIKMEYEGVDAISIDFNGRLNVVTSINSVFEMKPYAYQIIENKEVAVSCDFILKGNTVSFGLPEGYDQNYELIIDPTLIFSTYSGSPSDNWGSSATHDNLGNMFLGGIALGSEYPTTLGAFQTDFAGGEGYEETDVVITKFTANGNNRLYSTYLGGSSNEMLSSLYCTPQNELIALMATSSSDFPTSANAYDKTYNGGPALNVLDGSIDFPNGADIALTKLNVNGSGLVGSTFLGGSGIDGLNKAYNLVFNYGDETRGDIALDENGNIYVTSTTTSTDFPGTAGKAQSSNAGFSDAVISKLNGNLTNLEWSTYYGGDQDDASYSIQIDGNKNIFICGGTSSSNLPAVSGGLNSSFMDGIADGYVAKLSSNGNSFTAATYIGTSGYDQTHLMDLDISNNVYLFGQSLGNYPVSRGVYNNAGAKQYIQKLNNNLNTSVYSTVFGRPNSSSINISPTALLIDVCENIYAVGWGGRVNNTGSTQGMPITADAFDKTTDGSDFYLICLNRDADSLIYATFVGENGGVGDHVDGGTSRFDKNGVVYQAVCASCGGTDGFPVTENAYGQDNLSSNCNMAGFKFKFDLLAMQIITTTATPPSGCETLTTIFNYTSTRPGTSYEWNFGDGSPISTEQFPSHTYLSPGTYTVKFILRNPQDCNPIDSSTVTVTVGINKTFTLNRVICKGKKVTIGNQTFGESGKFDVVLISSNGCDSTITLILTVEDSIIVNKTDSFCEGKSIVVGGQTFTQPGDYLIKLRTTEGCDSFIKLNLIQIPKTRENLVVDICRGDSVKIGNQYYQQADNLPIILSSINGCDSIIILTIIIHPSYQIDLRKEICEGESFEIGNESFDKAGTYIIKLKSVFECDSNIILNLIVNPKQTVNITRNICSGQKITIGRETFDKTGVYTVVLKSAKECDSTVILNLDVTDTIFTNLSKEICKGDSIQIGDNIFNSDGNFTITLKAIGGCDSIVNLTLSLIDSFTTTLPISICKGSRYQIGNYVFNETGTYSIPLKAQGGCDSIINLILTVVEPFDTTITKEICNGDAIIIGDNIFDETGNYTIELKTIIDCDSTIHLNLIVYDPARSEINTSICEGSTYQFGNISLGKAGQYIDTLKTVHGCDSFVILNLSINANPIVNAFSDSILVYIGSQVQLSAEPQQGEFSYSWTPENLVSNSTISNPTSIMETSTLFFVMVEDRNKCSGKDSILVEVQPFPNTDCAEDNIFLPNSFSPNGDNKNDVYFVRSTIPLTSMLLIIYNRWGEEVFRTDSQTEGWNGYFKGKLAIGDAFGYYFEGTCGEVNILKKGNITIVR